MFNPQRKAKISDIYMQQKRYGIHLKKVDEIDRTLSLRSKRYQEEAEQQHYLQRISKSKKQVQDRLSANVRQENYRLMKKLLETDSRKQYDSISKDKKDHFNSYFSGKKQQSRIHNQNFTMVMRMNHLSSEVPTLRQMKKQYKQSRKYAKNCRKLPTILKSQEQYQKKFSQPILQSRLTSNQTHQRSSFRKK